jgi:septal ring factor EnvC (AmiA/AmiB activator)
MDKLIQPTRHIGTTFPINNADLNRVIVVITSLEESIKQFAETAKNLENRIIELESKIEDLSNKKQTKKIIKNDD